MPWQDIVFAAGGIIFALALLPALRDPQKPPMATSLTTGLWLAVFAVCYASLGFTLASITTSVSSVIWLMLAVQRRRREAL